MGRLREGYGKVMGRLWEGYGKVMGMLWEIMGRLWEIMGDYGKGLGNTYIYLYIDLRPWRFTV